MRKLLFGFAALLLGILATACASQEPNQTVQDIQLNFHDMVVRINNFYQLSVTIKPSNAMYRDIVWESSDTTIAKVNEKGMVATQSKTGSVKIIATHIAVNEADATVSDTCTMTVKPYTYKSITLDKHDYKTLTTGDPLQLSVKIKPDSVTYPLLEWSTSDPTIATVTQEGWVEFGKESGRVDIVVQHRPQETLDDAIADTCHIIVEPIVGTSINLNYTAYQLLQGGKTIQLVAVVVPTEATYQNMVWSSADPEIATVSAEGLVTSGNKAGKVIITATHPAYNEFDKELSVTCQIEVIKDESNLDMVWVEGATFMMGGTAEQGTDAQANEQPVHEVTLSGYYISKTEITQAQYLSVMGTNPSHFVGMNLPVENLTYMQAVAFCEKLSEMKGETYQLPTEAQWEFAARGGNASPQTKYAGSEDINAVAWYKDNATSQTHEVGTLAPNALGLYDMNGNVAEWCADKDGTYPSEPQTNPTGSTSGSKRVVRGGSYDSASNQARVSSRDFSYPARKHSTKGFRVVKVVK